MITWVFSTLILVFLPINIHENHWILLAANFWVHPKDASLFEMASLMGKPKGVATGDSELDYFHGTLPGWGSYKSRYYTNTTQWWKRLESPRSSKGYVLKKSWDAVSILTCSCFAVSILTCSCLKDEWILFKAYISWNWKLYFRVFSIYSWTFDSRFQLGIGKWGRRLGMLTIFYFQHLRDHSQSR